MICLFLVGYGMYLRSRVIILLALGLSFLITGAQGFKNKTQADTYAAIANDYEKQFFDWFPEEGLVCGRAGVALDRFSDASVTSLLKWQKIENNILSRVSAINPKTTKEPNQRISSALLKEYLENKKAVRVCHEALWDVNPLDGFQNMMPQFAERQPVGTKENRQLALKRWRTFDKVVNDRIHNLSVGIKKNMTAPKPAVERVINQVNMMITSRVEKSPFYTLARRDTDKHFKKDIQQLIINIINPSLEKYSAFLKKTYLPKARAGIGVWALHNGHACYAAKIKQNTALYSSAALVHEIGLQKVKRVSFEIGEIGLKRYGTSNIAETFRRANKEATGYFLTETDMLNYVDVALEKIKIKAHTWFNTIPSSEGVVRPYPLHMAKNGAGGEYWAPSDDGTRPGIFYLNTYEPKKQSRLQLEATLFHELIPGHHFQIALEHENKALPRLNKYLWNSGFGEGWALYVERLVDEEGLYRDDISRLGMLSNEALRAARLVVDTGIHEFHWTRPKAIAYLKKYTAMPDFMIESEVDRYIMNPGQATSYMLGKIEIESLRALAKKRLGKQFNIAEFHHQILQNGTVSLSILRYQIDAWLQRQKELSM